MGTSLPQSVLCRYGSLPELVLQWPTCCWTVTTLRRVLTLRVIPRDFHRDASRMGSHNQCEVPCNRNTFTALGVMPPIGSGRLRQRIYVRNSTTRISEHASSALSRTVRNSPRQQKSPGRQLSIELAQRSHIAGRKPPPTKTVGSMTFVIR